MNDRVNESIQELFDGLRLYLDDAIQSIDDPEEFKMLQAELKAEIDRYPYVHGPSCFCGNKQCGADVDMKDAPRWPVRR